MCPPEFAWPLPALRSWFGALGSVLRALAAVCCPLDGALRARAWFRRCAAALPCVLAGPALFLFSLPSLPWCVAALRSSPVVVGVGLCTCALSVRSWDCSMILDWRLLASRRLFAVISAKYVHICNHACVRPSVAFVPVAPRTPQPPASCCFLRPRFPGRDASFIAISCA